MTERTNVPVLKTGVGLLTVGSNPTPSARVLHAIDETAVLRVSHSETGANDVGLKS